MTTMKKTPHLNAKKIRKIVEILDGWSGKLTWDLLRHEMKPLVGEYSRQTLYNHTRIFEAFQNRKKELKNHVPGSKAKTVAEQKAHERIANLEAKASRLERENTQLLEQFVRWAYNASIKGISKEALNHPLPRIDREQTE